MHMKYEGQSKVFSLGLHCHPGMIKQGNTMLALNSQALSLPKRKREPGNIWEGKPLMWKDM